MVSVKVLKSRNEYVGFTCKGHAGSGDYGKDLVCCAISTLVINAINSIEELTDTEFELQLDEKTGFIDFKLKHKSNFDSSNNDLEIISKDTSLLLDSMVLGIRELAKENKKYVRLEIKEV